MLEKCELAITRHAWRDPSHHHKVNHGPRASTGARSVYDTIQIERHESDT